MVHANCPGFLIVISTRVLISRTISFLAGTNFVEDSVEMQLFILQVEVLCEVYVGWLSLTSSCMHQILLLEMSSICFRDLSVNHDCCIY